VWPFCWWVAVGIDHFSRRVMGVAAFKRPPTFRQVAAILRRTIRKTRAKPKYIICDKEPQFWCDAFKKWGKYAHVQLVDQTRALDALPAIDAPRTNVVSLAATGT